MKVKDMVAFLNGKFPLSLQEKYDNAGGQVLFRNEEIKGILVALDCDGGVVEEAMGKSVNLIITHHPLLFTPMRGLTTGDPKSEVIFELVKNAISLYSAHTNLDKVYFNKLAGILNLVEPRLCIETDISGFAGDVPAGFGVVGELREARTITTIMDILKKELDLEYIIYSGDSDMIINTVALINGSAGRMIEKIIKEHHPQCIITGDVGYHHSKTAMDYGVTVIDAGHYGTEKVLLNFLRHEIQDCLTKSGDTNGIRVAISETERNPFRLY